MLFLACVSEFHLCIRLSPDGPQDLVSSIRSRIVLPARDLMRDPQPSCDSLTSGPRCILFDYGSDTRAIHGVLDASVWGFDLDDIPDKVLLALSGYIQVTWRGSMQKYEHASAVTSLTSMDENRMILYPIHVDNEIQQFISIQDSHGSSYQLNSFYSYISFKGKFVSIVEFQIRAPADTGVFVRGYSDGVPRWFRFVRSGTVLDVGLPSSAEDPSLEGVDYIELIGQNAQILSLVISVALNHPSTDPQPPLFYLDGNLKNPLTGSAIEGRQLHASAHVIDLDTALRKNMRFKQPSKHIASAKDEPQFSYDHLLNCLNSTTIHRTDYPAKTIDNFIQSVESYMKNHPKSNFHETVTAKLVESPPDLVAFLIRVPEQIFDIHEAHPAITDSNSSVRFVPSNNRSGEIFRLMDILLVSLESVVGTSRFTDLVTMLKVNRFMRLSENQPEASVGLADQTNLDEQILTDVIVSVMQLPPLDQLSYEARKDVLIDAVTMLMPPDTTTAVEIEDLVSALLG